MSCRFLYPLAALVVLSFGSSARTQTLAWQFEVGDVHRYLYSVQSASTIDDVAAVAENNQRWVRWEVVETDGESAVLERRLEAVRTERSTALEQWVFDSRDDPDVPADADFTVYWSFAELDQAIHVRIDRTGRVLAVEARDDFAAALARLRQLRERAGLPEALSDEERIRLEEEQRQRLNPNSQQLLMPLLSGQSLTETSEWRELERPSLFQGRILQTLTYRIDGVEPDGRVRVVFTDATRFEFPPIVLLFLRFDAYSSPGHFVFDTQGGYLVDLESRVDARVRIRAPEGGASWKTFGFTINISATRLDSAE